MTTRVKKILEGITLNRVEKMLQNINLSEKGGVGSGIYDHKKTGTKKYIPHPREKGEEINKTETAHEGSHIELASKDSKYEGISIQNSVKNTGEHTTEEAQSYLRASGVPADMNGHMLMTDTKDGVQVDVWGDNNKVYMSRVFSGKYIHNSYFKISDDSAYKGHGAEIFKSQVDNAREEGYTQITTNAAKGTKANFNGYYTWPRLGYEQDNIGDAKQWNYGINTIDQTKNIKQTCYDAFLAHKTKYGTHTISQLMSTPDGREYWKAHGFTVNLKFNLKANSRDYKVLSEYLSTKLQTKALTPQEEETFMDFSCVDAPPYPDAVCNNCIHYLGGTKCDAFDVIPTEILTGENNHSEPLPVQEGYNNIIFEQK
jgi:hypothetical protein